MPPQVTCAFALPGKTGKCENHIFTQLDCVTHNAPVRYLPERKSCHLWCVWWRLTFVEILRHPINTVHWLSLQAWRRTTPMFYTVADTVTDLVHTEHVGNSRMRCFLPSSCVVHPVDRFDSERWFSSDQVIFLTMFCVFWLKSMHHLSEKTQFPGFLFPQVVQEH